MIKIVMEKSYVGQLLVANPLNPDDSLEKSVILIVSHSVEYSLGLQINRPLPDFFMNDVGEQIGIYLDSSEPVYYGGNMTTHKIHMIHSNDWSGLTTIKINDRISVTNDISVLTAIAKNEGPEYFRACAGFWGWEAGQLENQLGNVVGPKVKHRWETAPATIENVFQTISQEEHWHLVIEDAANQRINSWF